MKVLFSLLLLAPLSMVGQSVSTVIGGSQVLGAAGVQTQFQYNGRFGWTGVGYSNGGVRVGSYINMPLRMFTFEDTSKDKYRLGLGDQDMDASITTDEFDLNQAMVRGGSLLRHTKTSDLQVFVGNFSSLNMQPYLYSLYQSNPNIIGAIVGNAVLSKTLNLKSYNVFGDTATSIQSVSWKPKPNWNIGTAAGLGNSKPYFGNAIEYRRHALDLRAAYIFADDNFHRQDGTYGIEPLKFNAKAEIPFGERTMIRFSHRHQLMTVPQYLGFQYSSSLETTDSGGVSTSFLGFHANANATKSTSNHTMGADYIGSTSISRKIISRWNSTFSYLQTAMPTQSIEVYQNTNETRINNHLSLSQNLTMINGAVNNTFGGRWSSNRVSFSIDNQVYVSPVAASFGQKSVFQAWNFSIRFRTPHGTQTHLETIVDPFGKTQWGGYLSGLQYHGLGAYSTPEMQHVNFSKYVIMGKVVDGRGRGIWGIALMVGKDMVMSDNEGSFFIHVSNTKPVPFAVAADASIQAQCWTLASAPTSAHGTLEATAEPVRVVVQIGLHNREIARAGGN